MIVAAANKIGVAAFPGSAASLHRDPHPRKHGEYADRTARKGGLRDERDSRGGGEQEPDAAQEFGRFPLNRLLTASASGLRQSTARNFLARIL